MANPFIQFAGWLNQIGEAFWSFSANMALQVGVLVAVLLFLEFFLRHKTRAIVRYWIWVLVLIKLMLPVQLRTPASIGYWLSPQHSASARPDLVPYDKLSAQIDQSAVPAIMRTTITAEGNTETLRNSIAPNERVYIVAQSTTNSWPPIQWTSWLLIGWSATVFVLVTMLVRRMFRLSTLIARATVVPADIQSLFDECLETFRLNVGAIVLRSSDQFSSPAICGFLKPTILIPRQLLATLDHEQFRIVFAHEITHWKRWDLQINLFQKLLLIFYFYNPAVWIADAIIRRLREQAVDETVLAVRRFDPQRYGHTLLDIAAAMSGAARSHARLMAIVESKVALAARIQRIVAGSLPSKANLGFGGWLTVIALGIIVLPMASRDGSVAAQQTKHLHDEKSDANSAPPPGTNPDLVEPKKNEEKQFKSIAPLSVEINIAKYNLQGSDPEFSTDSQLICVWSFPTDQAYDVATYPVQCAVFDLTGQLVTEATDAAGMLQSNYQTLFPKTFRRQAYAQLAAEFGKTNQDITVLAWNLSPRNDLAIRVIAPKKEADAWGMGFRPSIELWRVASFKASERVWSTLIPEKMFFTGGLVAFFQRDAQPLILAAFQDGFAMILAPGDGTIADRFTYGTQETGTAAKSGRKQAGTISRDGDGNEIFRPELLAFEPQRRMLASVASNELRVRVINVDAPHQVLFEANPNANPTRPWPGTWTVMSLRFDAHQFLVASFAWANRLVGSVLDREEVFSLDSNRIVWSASNNGLNYGSPFISPDGKTMAVIKDNLLQVRAAQFGSDRSKPNTPNQTDAPAREDPVYFGGSGDPAAHWVGYQVSIGDNDSITWTAYTLDSAHPGKIKLAPATFKSEGANKWSAIFDETLFRNNAAVIGLAKHDINIIARQNPHITIRDGKEIINLLKVSPEELKTIKEGQIPNSSNYLPPESGMGQHSVPLDKFVQLRAGIKKADVEKLLGKAAQHQFAYLDEDSHAWQCEEYVVAEEPRYASSEYDLLYKDGSLYSLVNGEDVWWHYKALIGVGRGEIEDREKQEKRLRRTPITKFDDDANVREFFRIESLRGDDIAKLMPKLQKHILDEEREHKARDQRNPPDIGLTVVITAFNSLTPSQQAELKQAYKVNADFVKRYDGGKVAIGMTESQVNELFGPPLLKEALGDGRHGAIYGPRDTTKISKIEPYLQVGPVLVLYQDNAVIRVLSNFFFSSDWRDKVWPEFTSPDRGSRPE